MAEEKPEELTADDGTALWSLSAADHVVERAERRSRMERLGWGAGQGGETRHCDQIAHPGPCQVDDPF